MQTKLVRTREIIGESHLVWPPGTLSNVSVSMDSERRPGAAGAGCGRGLPSFLKAREPEVNGPGTR